MDLAIALMANNTLASLQQQIKFVPKEANPPCIAFFFLSKDYWAALKKAFYDKGWEAISFPILKQKICQKVYKVPLPIILRIFTPIKERLAICAQDRYWAIHH